MQRVLVVREAEGEPRLIDIERYFVIELAPFTYHFLDVNRDVLIALCGIAVRFDLVKLYELDGWVPVSPRVGSVRASRRPCSCAPAASCTLVVCTAIACLSLVVCLRQPSWSVAHCGLPVKGSAARATSSAS